MSRRPYFSLAMLLLALVLWRGGGQAQTPLPALLFTGDGTFARAEQGWSCLHLGSQVNAPLLRQMHPGDIVLDFDGRATRDLDVVGMAQFVRAAGWGIVTRATVLRDGKILPLQAPAESGAKPRIVTSQSSSRVLYSSLPEVVAGDELVRTLGKSWEALNAGFAESPGALRQLDINGHPKFTLRRQGKEIAVSAQTGVLLQFVRLPEENSKTKPFLKELLAALPASGDGRRIRTADLHGRWLLVHFFASWCVPCHREMPEILQLAKEPRLLVLASGYADTPEALRAFAASEQIPLWFPSSGAMIDLFGVDGIPYDVLISPEGLPAMVIGGTMEPGAVAKKVGHFLNQ
jgi:thiol-disulfide isomerase/thioredoxin